MIDTVTAYVTSPLIAAAIGLVLGALFGTHIKDFVFGVPAEFRAAMKAVEAKAKLEVKTATADVFSKFVPASRVAAPAPVAPAAPVVAAPAASVVVVAPEAPVAH